jgi:hypothetical protein
LQTTVGRLGCDSGGVCTPAAVKGSAIPPFALSPIPWLACPSETEIDISRIRMNKGGLVKLQFAMINLLI